MPIARNIVATGTPERSACVLSMVYSDGLNRTLTMREPLSLAGILIFIFANVARCEMRVNISFTDPLDIRFVLRYILFQEERDK